MMVTRKRRKNTPSFGIWTIVSIRTIGKLQLLTARIEEFTVGKLGLQPGYAYELYRKYGTCLKGMMAEKILDDNSVDEYLLWAHDVPLEEHIGKDEKLRGCNTCRDRMKGIRCIFSLASHVTTPRNVYDFRDFGFIHRYHRRESGRVGNETR